MHHSMVQSWLSGFVKELAGNETVIALAVCTIEIIAAVSSVTGAAWSTITGPR
jgi:hypothetical protein